MNSYIAGRHFALTKLGMRTGSSTAPVAKELSDEDQRILNAGLLAGGGYSGYLLGDAVGTHSNNAIVDELNKSYYADTAHLTPNAKKPSQAHLDDLAREKEIYEKLVQGHNVERGKPGTSPYRGSFSSKKNVITLGEASFQKNPATLAHELGHKHYFEKTPKIMHMLGNLGYSTFSKPWLGLIPGLYAYDAEKSNPGEESKTKRNAYLASSVLPTVPVLAEEAYASGHGLLNMYRNGATRRDMVKGIKTLLPAFGTYAGTAMKLPAVALGTYGATALLDTVDGKE
jgi:hypothetical protein